MKKILLACVFAQLVFMAGIIAPQAMAQSSLEGFYVGGKVFGSWQQHWAEPSVDFQSPSGSYNASKGYSFSDAALGVALAVGYDFYPRFDVPLRMDIEYALRTAVQGQDSYDAAPLGGTGELGLNSSLQVQTLMLNVYYDFYNSSRFTPYIMAGAGLAFMESSFSAGAGQSLFGAGGSTDLAVGKSHNKTNFAWQVGAGVSMAVNSHVSVDLGYRFVSLGHMDYDVYDYTDSVDSMAVSLKNTSTAHEIGLGFRYTFDGDDAQDVASTKQKNSADEPSLGVYISAKALAGMQTHWSSTTIQDNHDRYALSGDWTKATMGAALALGYDFHPRYEVPVRLELEYAMRSPWSGEKDFAMQGMEISYEPSVQVQTLMLNAAYDFHNSTRFTPYITAGLGVAFMDAELQTSMGPAGMPSSAFPIQYSAFLATLAWQVGAGVEVEITPSVSVDFGYKYLSFGHVDYDISSLSSAGGATFNMQNIKNASSIHELSAGLRYTF